MNSPENQVAPGLCMYALAYDNYDKRYKLHRITYQGNNTSTSKIVGSSKVEKHLLSYVPKDFIEILPDGKFTKTCKKLWFPNKKFAEKFMGA